MGLFDRGNCSICGAKPGLLGNAKLEDGVLCKECKSKLSPFFDERRHSTVAAIQAQLDYREKNRQELASFVPTRQYGDYNMTLLIDETQKKCCVVSKYHIKDLQKVNPDLIDLAQITACDLIPREDKDEIKYKDNDGNEKSYDPPQYKYSYCFDLKLKVNHPYFDDIDFRLNNDEVETGQHSMKDGSGVQAAELLNGLIGALQGKGGLSNLGVNPVYQQYIDMGKEIRSILIGA